MSASASRTRLRSRRSGPHAATRADASARIRATPTGRVSDTRARCPVAAFEQSTHGERGLMTPTPCSGSLSICGRSTMTAAPRAQRSGIGHVEATAPGARDASAGCGASWIEEPHTVPRWWGARIAALLGSIGVSGRRIASRQRRSTTLRQLPVGDLRIPAGSITESGANRSPSPAQSDHRTGAKRRRSGGHFADLVSLVKFERFLRMEPPLRSRRWALWTRRSRMASAMVGSPM